MMRTAVCPSSWKARSTSSTTRWPTWMSGAVGSMPSLTRSLSPRSRRPRRWSATSISTARSRSQSKSESDKLRLGYWAAAEVLVWVAGKHRCEDGDDRPVDGADHRHRELRCVDCIPDVCLRARDLPAAAGVRRRVELVDDHDRQEQ